jgi:hypothetical protein
LTNISNAKMAEAIKLKGASQEGQQVERGTGGFDVESVLKLRQQGVKQLGHTI